jgi:hypothetical protein
MLVQIIRSPQFKILLIFILALISQIIYENTGKMFFYYSFFVFIGLGFLAGLILTFIAFRNQWKEWKSTKRK